MINDELVEYSVEVCTEVMDWIEKNKLFDPDLPISAKDIRLLLDHLYTETKPEPSI